MRKCFYYRALVILGLISPGGFSGVALAQAAPEECQDLSGVNERGNAEITGCLKPIINGHALITVSDVIRKVIEARFAPGAGAVVAEPAGLALDNPKDIAARFAAMGTFAVEPASDLTATTTQQKLWNVWIDGKYSWIDGAADIDHSEGPLANAMVGIDYRLSSSVVLGILGTYEHSRLETEGALPISQKTDGYGGGAYVGVTLTPNIIFSGMATYAAIDTELGLSSDGETDSDRVQLSGAVTGYWYSGTTRLSPSLTLAWSKEWQDAFSGGLTPKQRFETGVLTGGTVIGHTLALAGTSTIEPWAGAFIDYTFINDATAPGPVAVGSYDEQVDLRLQLGFNLGLAGNMQLSVTGETSGLLLDETDTYAGEANLAIQF